jgi:hypothetical protein
MLQAIHLLLKVSLFISKTTKHLFHFETSLKTPTGSWRAMKGEVTISLVIQNKLESSLGDGPTLRRLLTL